MEYDCKGKVCEYNICRNVCIHTLSKMVSIGKNIGRCCIWKHICICVRRVVWAVIPKKSLNMDFGNTTFCVGCVGVFDIILNFLILEEFYEVICGKTWTNCMECGK